MDTDKQGIHCYVVAKCVNCSCDPAGGSNNKLNKVNKGRNKRALKPCRSFELRNGIMYKYCMCNKRNGLQHDCPRTYCQGHPCCLTVPDPLCCPSEHSKKYACIPMGKATNKDRQIKMHPCVGICNKSNEKCKFSSEV